MQFPVKFILFALTQVLVASSVSVAFEAGYSQSSIKLSNIVQVET